METKTVRTTIDPRVPASLAQGRLDAARVDATTPADIAAQQAADEAEAMNKWGQTPINLSALHNQFGVTGPKFGKDGAFRSITAVACNGPCMLQCYM